MTNKGFSIQQVENLNKRGVVLRSPLRLYE